MSWSWPYIDGSMKTDVFTVAVPTFSPSSTRSSVIVPEHELEEFSSCCHANSAVCTSLYW